MIRSSPGILKWIVLAEYNPFYYKKFNKKFGWSCSYIDIINNDVLFSYSFIHLHQLHWQLFNLLLLFSSVLLEIVRDLLHLLVFLSKEELVLFLSWLCWIILWKLWKVTSCFCFAIKRTFFTSSSFMNLLFSFVVVSFPMVFQSPFTSLSCSSSWSEGI